METFNVRYEEFKVRGADLVDKMRGFVHEGNVRRIIIKDDKGHTFMEIPLSVATLGALFMPLLAALGAVAALVADFTIVLERVEDSPAAEAPAAAAAGSTHPPEDGPRA